MTNEDKEYTKRLYGIISDIALAPAEVIQKRNNIPFPFCRALVAEKLREKFYAYEIARLLGCSPSAITHAHRLVGVVMAHPTYMEQAIYDKWHQMTDTIRYERTDKHR